MAKHHQLMVDRQLRDRDIDNIAVLDAMNNVPRHLFVPENWQDQAYEDRPLPIAHGQTISQPYIVALMTQLAEPSKDSKALDVGTGSGCQAAVLAELVETVSSIEISKPLGIPVGEQFRQKLVVRHKKPDGSLERSTVAPVACVPMTGDSINQR